MALLYIIAGLLVFFWALGRLSRSKPSLIAKIVRRLVGGVLVAIGGFLSLRGGAIIGGPILMFGLGLLGFQQFSGAGFPGMGGRKAPPGQISRVRTKLFAMELDHDTGHMDGTVLSGPRRGVRLSSLSLAEVLELAPLATQMGDRSMALLQAYLDRAHPEWQDETGETRGASSASAEGAMSRAEAYILLGLAPGADEGAIKAAHRKLMKKHHPDRGGNAEHAARINAAKELLIG